jgi:membrane protease YdiL (CAAX protease family)
VAADLLRGRLLLWATAFVAAAAVGLPTSRPYSSSPAAVVVGASVGLILFIALAGTPHLPRTRLRVTVVRAAYLAAAAAFEEILWRGLALGALLPRIGPVAALAATSVGFALWHVRSLGRRSAYHGITGCSFGAAFLYGGVAAAIPAHALYNVLVDLAVQAEQDPGRRV